MKKVSVFQAIIVVLLALSIAGHIWSFSSLRVIQSRTDAFVSIEDHNKAVRAANQLTLTVSNINTVVRGTHRQFDLLAEQIKTNTAAFKSSLDQLADQMEKLSGVTNLYAKVAEVEQAVGEKAQQELEAMTVTQRQTTTVMRMAGKLEALEKAVIKLSLAVQENQYALAFATSTPAPPQPTTNSEVRIPVNRDAPIPPTADNHPALSTTSPITAGNTTMNR